MVDRLIKEDYEVIVIDNESTGSRQNVHPLARYIHGDITQDGDLDQAFREGPNVVFHIAGQASIVQSFSEPERDLKVNVNGTINVVKKCIQYQVPRLLYASSMTVYGHPRTLPTPETEPCLPVSYYGITKYAAERYVHATAERSDLGFDFHVTSFRMFNVYGERQSLTNPYQGVIAIFIGNLLRGEPLTIHSDGEQSRDFVHIHDVVEAWILALKSRAAYGQVFNLGTGYSHSVNELADIVLGAFGHSRDDYPVLKEADRVGNERSITADISRSSALLSWKPKIPFQEGMIATVRWAVANRLLAYGHVR